MVNPFTAYTCMHGGLVVVTFLGAVAGTCLAAAWVNMRRAKKLRYAAELLQRDAKSFSESLRELARQRAAAVCELEREAEHYRAASRALEETRQRGLN